MELKIFDYEAYNDEFQAVKDEMVVDAVGWNGRKISIIPLYNLLDGICPKAELMKLKPFDVIQFEETNIYESYLIVPLKVKQKYEVCLNNIDNTLKDFLLCYGLIKFEVNSIDGNAYLPPESLDIIEKGINGGHTYFKDLYNFDRYNGIIVDHYFIKKNFTKMFNKLFNFYGNIDSYEQIAFLNGVNKVSLSLNDADEEQINSMKNEKCKLLIRNSNHFTNIIKDENSLNDLRKNSYPNSFNLIDFKKNTEITSKTELTKSNEIKKGINNRDEKPKSPSTMSDRFSVLHLEHKHKSNNLQSKKKDDLIKIINKRDERLNELEVQLFHLNNDLQELNDKYKVLKAQNNDQKNDLCADTHKFNLLFSNLKKINEQFSCELRKVDM
jgi:hypothetical protein